jgi:DNA-binding NarL/FixJ family response regulator
MKTEPTEKTIYLVDDHPVVTKGIAMVLNEEPDLKVCGSSDDVDQVLRDINTMNPDLVIVDISLKGANGLDLVKALKTRHPDLKTMILSMHDESLYAERSLKSGARGYLMKNEVSETIVDAVREVLGGGIYLSKKMSSRFLQRYVVKGDEQSRDPLDILTNRELEVFRFIGQGYAPREIASCMGLKVKTIETYRERIKQKLDFTSSTEMNRYAITWYAGNLK